MMKKQSIILFLIFTGMLLFPIGAMGGKFIPTSDKGDENSGGPDNSPVIKRVDEGLVFNTAGLDRIVFIHYKKGFAKPPWAGTDKKQPTCYGFLGKGIKWIDLPIDLWCNLADLGAVSEAAGEWEDHTGTGLFSALHKDSTANWDSDTPDGRNELSFGNYPDDQVIAVTVVWGYFSGPPSIRQILEFDILFNTDFSWGDATKDGSLMDLQNIATHEIGHGFGLDDLYDLVCSEETMYGYSYNGETSKRDLANGDITGLQELYGQ
jgi:hypothetical protein